MAEANADWLCPVCSLKRFKYGTNCPKFEDRTCENLAQANIAGRWYLRDDKTLLAPTSQEIKGIGISEISE